MLSSEAIQSGSKEEKRREKRREKEEKKCWS
jgi:hypothetical protein